MDATQVKQILTIRILNTENSMEAIKPFSYKSLEASPWLLSDPLKEKELMGNVVVLYAFQMLCPACILHGSPLAQKINQIFSSNIVKVIGIHTVFEHHSVMGPKALEVYLSEFRYSFPVVIDQHSTSHPIPDVMRSLELQGTPSFLLFDKEGKMRYHYFGTVDALQIGFDIGQMVME